MRDTTRLTRRRWATVCGSAVVAGLAGCLGGDTTGGGTGSAETGGAGGSDGSGNTDGGSGPSDDPEPSGQLVESATISERTTWDFDLESGETIAVAIEATDHANAKIFDPETLERYDSIGSVPSNAMRTMQHTAEEAKTYRVRVEGEGQSTVEIYVESG